MVNSRYANAPYSHPPPSYPQHPPGYTDTYAQQQQQQQQQHHQQQYAQNQQYQQQQQQYQPTPPNIRNPFAPPPPARSAYASQNAAFDPEFEAQVAQWQSAYAPQEPQQTRSGRGERGDAATSNYVNADSNNTHAIGVGRGPAAGNGIDHDGGATSAAGTGTDSTAATTTAGDNGKKKTVMRKGGGQTWEDSTLLEWDPTQFRLMVGNLAGEVTDDSLAKAFAQYGVSKARVVRDKRTTKSRGYGFVSFTDGELGFKAAREMVGKYIGSHPVTIQRSKTDLRPVAQKDRGRGGKNNHHIKNKQDAKQDDPLRAHTGAHIERKPVRNPNGMKMLG